MDNTNTIITVVIAILIILGVGGFVVFNNNAVLTSNESGGERTSPEGGFESPDKFALLDHDGNTVSARDFRGKILVLNTWATWCPFCVDELPDFAALQSEFPDEIAVVAINRAEPLSVAKEYTDGRDLTGSLTFLIDPRDSFYKSIGGFSMPETLFVDRNGDIVTHKRGPMNLEEMRERITLILES